MARPVQIDVVIRQSGMPDRTVTLRPGTTRIGRSEDNDLVLPDIGVSRHHLQVHVDPEGATVEDNGSGNGTYLAGRRIQSQRLRDGDEISVDPFVLRFRVEGGKRVRRVVSRPTGWLEVLQGLQGTTARYPVDDAGAIIGRSEDAEVVLADAAVSRHHARIDVRGGTTTLKDLGSANGVFVNGARVRERTIAHGDVVRIGNSDLRWLLADGAATDRSVVEAPSIAPQPPSLSTPLPTIRETQGSSLWLVAAAGVSAVLVFVIAALGLALGGFLWWQVHEQPVAPVRALAWQMRLPAGLPASSTRSLFDHGVDRMKAGAYHDAIEDFYRVLSVDPGDADARKFAVAASELLVLDRLGRATRSAADVRARDVADRDRLLARRDRGARQALVDRWGDDPAVIAAVGPTQASRAAADAVEAATRASARGTADARALWQALRTARDPAHRAAARTALAALDADVATRSRGAWQAAARDEIGRAPSAPAGWRALAAAEPGDVSARLHVRRFSP